MQGKLILFQKSSPKGIFWVIGKVFISLMALCNLDKWFSTLISLFVCRQMYVRLFLIYSFFLKDITLQQTVINISS